MFWDTPAHLIVLKPVLLLTVSIHFAWLGVLAGGATTAVVLDLFGTPDHRRGLATALLDRLGPGVAVTALLGLTATLILLGVQFSYPPLVISGTFWVGTLAPLLAGLVLLTLYRPPLRRGRG